ncbi:MAG: outer membrane beta-barrel protein [Pseudomonadota bacterium]
MKKTAAVLVMMMALVCAGFSARADDGSSNEAKHAKGRAAGGNFSVGAGPAGNIFVVDSTPELGQGVGGYLYFDYRWSPQFSTQFGVLLTTQDGTGPSNGDDGVILMGVPTFDLKFYILSNPSRWDPYGLIGMGIYAITKGSAGNGTRGVGIGADLGLGTDYYVSERFSVGLAGVFRSIGIITSMNAHNNGTALFPFTMMGNIAYHF